MYGQFDYELCRRSAGETLEPVGSVEARRRFLQAAA
jgi:hypothetical protein